MTEPYFVSTDTFDIHDRVNYSVKKSQLKINEEHTLIMTREVEINEGIAAMEERAAEYIK